MHVGDEGEDEVRAEVPQFETGAYHWEAEPGKVGKKSARDQGDDEDREVRERLACQVGEDDLGRHAAENERHGDGEKNQSVLAQQSRIRRVEPCHAGKREDNDLCPFRKHRDHGEAQALACSDRVVHACRQVCCRERAEEDKNPEIV